MEKIVERVVQTYGMLENLHAVEMEKLRDRVHKFIEHEKTGDEGTITIEAMRYCAAQSPLKPGALVINPNCPICHGLGWVCENHPHLAWTDDPGRCMCGREYPVIATDRMRSIGASRSRTPSPY